MSLINRELVDPKKNRPSINRRVVFSLLRQAIFSSPYSSNRFFDFGLLTRIHDLD